MAVKPRRPSMTRQESCASSVSHSSYGDSSHDMQHSVPSFNSFLKSVPPIADKPPAPGRRRASSLYSRHVTTPFMNDDLPPHFAPHEFFLQPVSFSYSSPQLVDGETPEHPIFLEAKTYTPSTSEPSLTTPTSQAGYLATLPPTTYTRTPSPRTVPSERQHSQLVTPDFTNPTLSSLNFGFSPANDYRQTLYTPPPEVFDDLPPEVPEIPIHHKTTFSPTTTVPLFPHERAGSTHSSLQENPQGKALMSLGLDQNTIRAESERKAHNHSGWINHKLHAPPRQREYAHYMPQTRDNTSTPSSLQDYGSKLMSDVDAEDEQRTEAELMREEYHQALTERYRDERHRRDSDDSTKAEMRLVPPPLFFHRNRQNNLQWPASGKSNTSKTESPRYTPVTGKDRERVPIHIPNFLKRRSSASNSSDTPPPTSRSTIASTSTKAMSPITKFFAPVTATPAHSPPTAYTPSMLRSPARTAGMDSPSPTQNPLAASPLLASPRKPFVHEVRPPVVESSAYISPFKLPFRTGFWSEQKKTVVDLPPARQARAPRSPSHMQKLTAALEKAKQELADRVHLPDLSNLANVPALVAEEERERRRREELKASIRMVGSTDPNAVEVRQEHGYGGAVTGRRGSYRGVDIGKNGFGREGIPGQGLGSPMIGGDPTDDYRGWSRRVGGGL